MSIWIYDAAVARAATTADVFNAVAEPRRRQLLDLIAGQEVPVNDLVVQTGMAQPLVSKHLRVLRAVGAVSVRDEGRQRLYRLNGEALKPIHDWLMNVEAVWAERLDHWALWVMAADHAVGKASYPTDTEILITRVFDAPKEVSLSGVDDAGAGAALVVWRPRHDDDRRDGCSGRRIVALRLGDR